MPASSRTSGRCRARPGTPATCRVRTRRCPGRGGPRRYGRWSRRRSPTPRDASPPRAPWRGGASPRTEPGGRPAARRQPAVVRRLELSGRQRDTPCSPRADCTARSTAHRRAPAPIPASCCAAVGVVLVGPAPEPVATSEATPAPEALTPTLARSSRCHGHPMQCSNPDIARLRRPVHRTLVGDRVLGSTVVPPRRCRDTSATARSRDSDEPAVEPRSPGASADSTTAGEPLSRSGRCRSGSDRAQLLARAARRRVTRGRRDPTWSFCAGHPPGGPVVARSPARARCAANRTWSAHTTTPPGMPTVPAASRAHQAVSSTSPALGRAREVPRPPRCRSSRRDPGTLARPLRAYVTVDGELPRHARRSSSS